MQICKIKEQGTMALFEVRVDDEDPEPIKIWSTNEKHAIREATLYATVANILISAPVANILISTQILNMLCQGR